MYLTFTYASQCKRENQRGLRFFAHIFVEDFLLIAVAFAAVSGAPLLTVLGLLCLFMSFWAIYEIGYFENDQVAATIEPNGKVPKDFDHYRDRFSEPTNWVTAGVLGIMGIAIFVWSGVAHPIIIDNGPLGWVAAGLAWAIVLIGLREVYRVYNYSDKATRVYLYAPLQLFKYGFGIVFLALPAAGAALLFSQIFRRWIPYVIYRATGSLEAGEEKHVLRLIVFVFLWILLLPAAPLTEHLIVGGLALALLFLRGWAGILMIFRRATSAGADTWSAT